MTTATMSATSPQPGSTQGTCRPLIPIRLARSPLHWFSPTRKAERAGTNIMTSAATVIGSRIGLSCGTQTEATAAA